jgi:hypothetical protein
LGRRQAEAPLSPRKDQPEAVFFFFRFAFFPFVAFAFVAGAVLGGGGSAFPEMIAASPDDPAAGSGADAGALELPAVGVGDAEGGSALATSGWIG